MPKGNPDIAKAGEATRFSSDNQPSERGRKGKSTTEYLKELGEANTIEFNITITDKDGKEVKKSGKVESHSSINELLANLLIVDAIKGNHKARKEILDRTEGRSKQSIDHTTKGDKLESYSREELMSELKELLLPDNAE